MTKQYWRLIGFICAAFGLALIWRPPSFATRHDWFFLLVLSVLIGIGLFTFSELFETPWEGKAESSKAATHWRFRSEGERDSSKEPDRRKRRATTPWQRRNEAERIYRDRMRRSMVVGLVVVVALGFWLGSFLRASNQSRDRVEEELIALFG